MPETDCFYALTVDGEALLKEVPVRFSRLTKITALLAVFFAADKAVALLRQVIIARQFGFSPVLDAFNVANNVPDLIYALISGGALAIAFIPVLTETLTHEGRAKAWDLFSRVANLVFLITAALSILTALLAGPLVQSRVGVAPGFGPEQQDLVVELMRLNLIATLIFSISGLAMAGLQANQHFLMPAIAPILYNLGQVFGALILSPEKGYRIAGFTLPAFGLGIHGLVYGVILGALLHLLVQVPALIHFQFHWIPSLGLKTEPVRKVLRLMIPRLVTMSFIQAIFLVRDNLASRLAQGSVTALTYGWMVQQVPETLIGTAIGTAMLPALSEMVAREQRDEFHQTIERAVRVLVSVTLPAAAVMGVGLGPVLAVVFKFGPEGTQTLLWATRGFLLGLTGHSLMEVASRSFYARQDARTPMIAGAINLGVYVLLGLMLYRPLGVGGISLTDAIAFSSQAVILLVILARKTAKPVQLGDSFVRASLAAVLGGGVTLLVGYLPFIQRQPLVGGLVALAAGAAAALPLIWKELRLLLKL